MSSDPILIIAPHVDDETIGCFMVLEQQKHVGNVTVMYLEELSGQRTKEARFAASVFNFTPVFSSVPIEEYKHVLIPCRQDLHPAHRRANCQYRSRATHFYSTNMEGAEFLGEEIAAKKRRALNTCYPSQIALWENDARYWMFESILERDWEVYEQFLVGDHLVRVPTRYAQEVKDWSGLEEYRGWGALKVFNHIVSMCPLGRVSLRDIGGNERFSV